MGDALTGLIGGLIAQGYSAEESAVIGTFIHGYSGDLVALEIGTIGITASDLVNKIPHSLKSLETQKEVYFEEI